MDNTTKQSNDKVTLEEVHRLLATTEFASAQDLVTNTPLVDLRERPRPSAPEASSAVEPGAPSLPKRR